MNIPDAPYAMVPDSSAAMRGLLALGWAITDEKDGWAHMEPPEGPPVLVRYNPKHFEPKFGDPGYQPSIELRELELGPNDMLVVTAEDIDADMIEQLREQVHTGLEDPNFTIIANFDIVLTTVRRPGVDDGPLRLVE